MSKIKCVVIEDEPLAVRVLVNYISKIPFLELEATFKDAIQATEYLHTNSVDLIFLDIHLPKLKGIAFLKTLHQPPSVIITTAYHQYAVDGFTLNVTDYLLKPIEFERFLIAVNKVKTERSTAAVEGQEVKGYFFVSVQKKKTKISFPEIIYIESQREYVKIVTTKNTYLPKMTITELELSLPANQFARIHRSYIVSISKIETYSSDSVEVNGIEIPIGRGYKEAIEKLLQ
jgi:DNA-binding LytR/AlgR family response regulator